QLSCARLFFLERSRLAARQNGRRKPRSEVGGQRSEAGSRESALGPPPSDLSPARQAAPALVAAGNQRRCARRRRDRATAGRFGQTALARPAPHPPRSRV